MLVLKILELKEGYFKWQPVLDLLMSKVYQYQHLLIVLFAFEKDLLKYFYHLGFGTMEPLLNDDTIKI